MKLTCAWCKKVIQSDSEPVITHGLCPGCVSRFDPPAAPPLRDFLEGLGAPIVYADPHGKVLAANTQACRMLGRDPERVEGAPWGPAFECRNSSLPEGCGNTVHCLGCAIRRTVTDTLETGDSHLKIPAFVSQEDRRLCLSISTEKVSGMVLLRIDRSEPAP